MNARTRFSKYQVVCAREPSSFWREKRDSSSPFTTGFRENLVVAVASYQMLEVCHFANSARCLCLRIRDKNYS